MRYKSSAKRARRCTSGAPSAQLRVGPASVSNVSKLGRLSALAATQNSAGAQLATLQSRLWILSALNILLLLSAAWAMVAKPGG